ncbi:MBL fold metallo-hydrolase [Cytobacillus sp. IB215316]|uniref:MBL fold metallo-hydrolase n=1 Tax=Cytobacillus sp. IB215316 TaxID=3097354 RepID=UPI002A1724CA|nr:MBL fold metallo-hydrolase [Cytobacillus sp. IB215316]MDX8362614.1 MBL fold metallo-hydrolase [Cytobacillus sp. IB215316]
MIIYKNQYITVFQSALFQTTSTVIILPEFVLVVDPTWLPAEVEQIKEYVYRNKGDRKLYLLFTHSDWDHIIGYGAFPDATIIASFELVNKDHKEKVRILEQIYSFDDRNYIERGYEITYPKVNHVIQVDGEQLTIEGTTLTFYKAQGHTDCGLFTVIEPLGIFLAGDYLSDCEFPLIYHSSKAYELTLNKVDGILEQHDIKLMIPGHGAVTEDKSIIKQRKLESMTYIKQLRALLQENNKEQIEKMIEKYRFPRMMKDFHKENQQLLSRELGIS